MADSSWNFTLNIDEIIQVDVIKITITKKKQARNYI